MDAAVLAAVGGVDGRDDAGLVGRATDGSSAGRGPARREGSRECAGSLSRHGRRHAHTEAPHSGGRRGRRRPGAVEEAGSRAAAAAVQARSNGTTAIARPVQLNNQTIPAQRAPAAPAPGPWDAALLGATGNPHGDSALEEDDGSLFGDAEDDGEPASALGLSLGPPRPAEDNGGPGTAAQAPPPDGAKHAAPPSQLVLPGMDAQEGQNGAPAAFALCLPGRDATSRREPARTGQRAHLPTWTPLGHAASSEATTSAAASRAVQPPVALAEKPRAKKKASSSSTSTVTSSAGSSSRKQRQTQTRAPGPPALNKQSRAPQAAPNATPDHVMRMYNLKSYAWMPSGAGPSSGPV